METIEAETRFDPSSAKKYLELYGPEHKETRLWRIKAGRQFMNYVTISRGLISHFKT